MAPKINRIFLGAFFWKTEIFNFTFRKIGWLIFRGNDRYTQTLQSQMEKKGN